MQRLVLEFDFLDSVLDDVDDGNHGDAFLTVHDGNVAKATLGHDVHHSKDRR